MSLTKRTTRNHLLLALLLFGIAAYCGLVPKPKYQSIQLLKTIQVPSRMGAWYGKDVSEDLKPSDDRYNFISESFFRLYRNRYQEELLYIILDGGKFHNPKVCFSSSGYRITELGTIPLELPKPHQPLQTQMLFAQAADHGYLLVYWLCIDQQISSWTQHQWQLLWDTLLHRSHVGLMNRIDIPCPTEKDIPYTKRLAEEFLHDLYENTSPETRAYLLGNTTVTQ